jgi:DNA-binding MarR family transcriptional regulator
MQSDPHTDALDILKAVLSLARRLRVERAVNRSLALSALGVLATLDRLGPMSVRRLAAAESLQPQSLTRLLASLETKGAITRTRSSADRRELTVALTEAGRRLLVGDMHARRVWLERTMMAALTSGERAHLLAAAEPLRKLARHGARECDR